MVLKVFGDDATGFTLHDGGNSPIGWIRGRALGFRCFADEEESVAAAHVAYDALAGWISKNALARPLPRLGAAKLRIVHDGAYEWVSAGRVPVARLLRPPADSARAGCHGIELVLPAGIGEVAAIGGAQVVFAALARRRATAAFAAAGAEHEGRLER